MTANRPSPDDPPAPQIAGVVLAGGLSRRMGGGDKGFAEVAGQPMLAHVIARLQPQVSALVLNANGDPVRFARFGLPVVADTVPDFPGPLAGALAGMHWARAQIPRFTHIVTVPGDAPLLPRDLVARLKAAAAGQDRVLAVAQSEGNLHPVIALWPVALAEDLAQALHDDVRQVRRWMDRHGVIPVSFAATQVNGHTLDPFFNANTPDDLARLRAALDGAGS